MRLKIQLIICLFTLISVTIQAQAVSPETIKQTAELCIWYKEAALNWDIA